MTCLSPQTGDILTLYSDRFNSNVSWGPCKKQATKRNSNCVKVQLQCLPKSPCYMPTTITLWCANPLPSHWQILSTPYLCFNLNVSFRTITTYLVIILHKVFIPKC